MTKKADDQTGLRLPALEVERLILSRIEKAITSLKVHCADKGQLGQLDNILNDCSESYEGYDFEKRRECFLKHLERVVIRSDKLIIKLKKTPFAFLETEHTFSFEYPLALKRRGVETKFVIGDQPITHPDQGLIQLIAKANRWWSEIKSGTTSSQKHIAERENLDKADVSRTIRLAFLSPQIVRDIINGAQPVDLTIQSLSKKASQLPTCWDLQKPYLGYTA